MPGPVVPVAAPVIIAKKKAVGSASARMANSAVRNTRAKTQSSKASSTSARSGTPAAEQTRRGSSAVRKTKADRIGNQSGMSDSGLRQKKFPSHPARVPSRDTNIAVHQLPHRGNIPTTPHTPSMKGVVTSFIKNVGMNSLLKAAFMTLAERKPDKAAMASSMAELAFLANAMRQDKRDGLTGTESLLTRVPQVAQVLVDVGINVNDIIRKHLQKKRHNSHETANIQDAKPKRTHADTLDPSLRDMPDGQALSKKKLNQIYLRLLEEQGRQEAAQIIDEIVKNLPDANF